MNDLGSNEQTLLLIALQNGIGLSSACEITMIDIKIASEYIKKNKDFHISCTNAIKSAAAGNLENLSKLKKQKKFSEWQRQQQQAHNFITELNLWECYCKKDEVDEIKIMKAAHIYKTIIECATAVGMYKRELVEYIIENELLATYFSQTNLYNF